MRSDDPREALRADLQLGLVETRCCDARVVEAVLDTPRERYVDDSLQAHAYEDRPLPLGEGQTISQPTMVAVMIDALRPLPGDTLLDVGTGSGYQAAILARLAARVFGIERLRGLARRAARNLASDPGVRGNVRLVVGDAWRGFPGRMRFDGIVVAAAAVEVPEMLVTQLAPGGRLIVPVGEAGGVQELVRVLRHRDGSLASEEALGACAFVPLVRSRGVGRPLP